MGKKSVSIYLSEDIIQALKEMDLNRSRFIERSVKNNLELLKKQRGVI